MTLSTDLVIIEPTNPRKVFDFALSLLAEDFDGEPTWDYTRKGEGNPKYPASTSHYATTCGQGLAAWLFVHHADDGPLTIADEYREDDEPRPPCDKHCIRIDWDTGYSYRGKNGEGCGDLHARMVATVGHWLDEQGLTWWWQNEFTGEWHRGAEGLDELGNAGDEAKAWFTGTVLPAIESGLIR
jgi:hypothetical protein